MSIGLVLSVTSAAAAGLRHVQIGKQRFSSNYILQIPQYNRLPIIRWENRMDSALIGEDILPGQVCSLKMIISWCGLLKMFILPPGIMISLPEPMTSSTLRLAANN